jgi:hypothetical protein
MDPVAALSELGPDYGGPDYELRNLGRCGCGSCGQDEFNSGVRLTGQQALLEVERIEIEHLYEDEE